MMSPDVLEIADESEEGDFPAREVLGHQLAVQPGEVELDLALEIVHLVVTPHHLLEEILAADPEHAGRVAQHPWTMSAIRDASREAWPIARLGWSMNRASR